MLSIGSTCVSDQLTPRSCKAWHVSRLDSSISSSFVHHMVPFLRIPVAVSPRILNHFNLCRYRPVPIQVVTFTGSSDLRTLNVQHKLSFISIFISKIRLGKRPAFQTPFNCASNCKYFHVGIHAFGGCRSPQGSRDNLTQMREKAGTKGRPRRADVR